MRYEHNDSQKKDKKKDEFIHYHGEWKNGKYHGTGKLQNLKANYLVVGEFKNGEIDG